MQSSWSVELDLVEPAFYTAFRWVDIIVGFYIQFNAIVHVGRGAYMPMTDLNLIISC